MVIDWLCTCVCSNDQQMEMFVHRPMGLCPMIEDQSVSQYLGVIQQLPPAVLERQVRRLLFLLPGILVEGELRRNLGQTELCVGLQLSMKQLHAVHLLTHRRKANREHLDPLESSLTLKLIEI